MEDPCSRWELLDVLTLFLQRNLTGSVYRSGRAGPACRSDKVSTEVPGAGAWPGLSPRGATEPPSLPGPCASPLQDQKILLSIYNISMSLREVGAGTLQGPEELAVWRVARNTNFVLRENCRKISKVGSPLLPSHVSGSQFPGLWAELALFVLSWLPMRSLQALPALLWELGNADYTSIPGSSRLTKGGRFSCGSVGFYYWLPSEFFHVCHDAMAEGNTGPCPGGMLTLGVHSPCPALAPECS